jgi:hypothetical protein
MGPRRKHREFSLYCDRILLEESPPPNKENHPLDISKINLPVLLSSAILSFALYVNVSNYVNFYINFPSREMYTYLIMYLLTYQVHREGECLKRSRAKLSTPWIKYYWTFFLGGGEGVVKVVVIWALVKNTFSSNQIYIRIMIYIYSSFIIFLWSKRVHLVVSFICVDWYIRTKGYVAIG